MQGLVDRVGFTQESIRIIIKQGQCVAVPVEDVEALFRCKKSRGLIVVNRNLKPLIPVPVLCAYIKRLIWRACDACGKAGRTRLYLIDLV